MIRAQSVEEAVNWIRPGSHVVVSHAASAPQSLLRELARQAPRFEGNPLMIYHMVPIGYTGYLDHPKSFVHVSLFAGKASRLCHYVPIAFSKIPKWIQLAAPEVLLMSSPGVSCANGDCRFQLGLSRDYLDAAIRSAPMVICQENRRLPKLQSGLVAQARRNDQLVLWRCDEDPPECPDPEPDDVSRGMAANVAKLVGHGSALQVGIGKLGRAVLEALWDRRGIRVYSEMLLDGMVQLIRNSREVATAAFALGTQELYRFMDGEPELIDLQPVDAVNDPRNIASVPHLRSVCFAAQVDMWGQVVADCPGGVQVSGIGGMIDFAIGCHLSDDARFIVALPSSRIVEKASGPVAVDRNLVDWVVTEKGAVQLKGKTALRRRQLLEGIA